MFSGLCQLTELSKTLERNQMFFFFFVDGVATHLTHAHAHTHTLLFKSPYSKSQ